MPLSALGAPGLLTALACALESQRSPRCDTLSHLSRPFHPDNLIFCATPGAKVVAKARPGERVGVFARRGGGVHVVEYSELDPALASAVSAPLSYAARVRVNCGCEKFLQAAFCRPACCAVLLVSSLQYSCGESIYISPHECQAAYFVW